MANKRMKDVTKVILHKDLREMMGWMAPEPWKLATRELENGTMYSLTRKLTYGGSYSMSVAFARSGGTMLVEKDTW